MTVQTRREPPRRTFHLRVLAALFIAFTLVASIEAAPAGTVEADLSDLDGLPIVHVEVIRHNMFDTDQPETSAWPYRAANAVHMVTRESFIRDALLFTEGDPFSAARAAESARILRSLGFMNPVTITAHRVEGGVEVVVETRDLWTLEVGGQFGIFGGRSETGFAFTEKNFLGWGREVSIEYESNNERRSWRYTYFDPLFLGTRWRLRLDHQDLSDGFRDRVHLEYPFYSLETRYNWGAEWRHDRLFDHLYSNSDTVVKGIHRLSSWRVWGGLKIPGGGDIVRRATVGWEHREERFEDWHWVDTGASYPAPADQHVEGIRIGYQQVADRYVVLQGFRAWTVQEDVALGPNFNVGVTTSLPAFGADERRHLFDGTFSMAVRDGSNLLLGKAWTSGRVDVEGARNVVLGVQIAATQLGDHGWQGRLMVEDSHHLDLNRQLTLGADVGLRGWDPDTFDGTGRAVANLQYRTLFKRDIWHFFSLGIVGFVDSGYTWGARVGRATARVRADAGIGLLADMTHLGLAQLVRLDVAMPDDGSGYVITLTSSALF